MDITDNELFDSLGRFNSRQIQLAGQRYTPGIDPSAPNIRIAPLVTAIESVDCGGGARRRFDDFTSALGKAWDRAKHSCEKRPQIEAEIGALPGHVDALVSRLRTRDSAALDAWDKRLAALVTEFEREQNRWRAEEDKLLRETNEEAHGPSSKRDTVRHHINQIGECVGAIRDEREFLASSAGRALVDPSLLVSGLWGTGKTHVLCDITQRRVAARQPTLFILAKSFQGSRNLLPVISGGVVPDMMTEELFDRLQQLGEASGERALVIVDGVNEGRRAEWRRAITALCELGKGRSHVGLVVSCRTPFERAAIASGDLSRFLKVEHRGFEDQEFDAQAAFFQYYKLPLPEVPLLDGEFSRPLTLKLICQSLQNLTGRKIREGFSGIASGQKGMTYVLESFVDRVGEPIQKEFGLPPKACWKLLKGDSRIADPRAAGFAPNMAATMREHVRTRAARAIIAAHFPALSPKRRRELLDALRTNGLIDEDVIWHRTRGQVKPRTVFRLPYQRFSDHLVARHLLEKYLTNKSERTMTRSFARGSPLSRVFRRANYGRGYARDGWAQALITEFPERVKKTVPRVRRELYFFLPPAARRLPAYYEPFVEGLFWRDPSAFTRGTGRVVGGFLNAIKGGYEYRLLDALVAVSTKPKHPYSAMALYRYLGRMEMPKRDLWWSEYLRKGYSSPTIRRLLAWAERLERAEMNEAAARELVILLSLVLTTVVRRERDLATRALVVIGEKHPRVVFEHALDSLAFGDPYASERMLAAAYGVTMSLVDDSAAADFRGHLGWFAGKLYRNMFTPQAPHRTHHVLRREYALGVIDLARRARAVTLPSAAKKYLSPPFAQIPSPFPNIGTVAPDVHETGRFAIHMDFGNYTIGHLIPGRGNYDSNHPEYKRVLAQIEWRIHDLGLRKSDFADIDDEIGRTSFSRERDGNRVDRYGKKYAWIAFFEMYGVRQSVRALPDWRQNERTPECDIDPSFPKPSPQ
jgi:hypothetical protein